MVRREEIHDIEMLELAYKLAVWLEPQLQKLYKFVIILLYQLF